MHYEVLDGTLPFTVMKVYKGAIQEVDTAVGMGCSNCHCVQAPAQSEVIWDKLRETSVPNFMPCAMMLSNTIRDANTLCLIITLSYS